MRKKHTKNIINSLRKYRKIRGLKQKDVAWILGVKNSGMISRWEKGKSFPKGDNILNLAILYRTSSDDLFIDRIRLLRSKIIKREKEFYEKNRIYETE